MLDPTSSPADFPNSERCLSREPVRAWAQEAGFAEAGLVALPHLHEGRDAARFEEWVGAGRSGTMKYLERRGEDGKLTRARVGNPFPWARSAIVCFASYDSAQPRSTDPPREGAGWIARYAWSSRVDAAGARRPSDYHKVLLKRIKRLEERLRGQFGTFEARGYVDTGPVVERALATAAGLGWTGKNTCLIHPKLGSFGFLAVLVTSLEVAEDEAREEAVIADPILEKYPSGAKEAAEKLGISDESRKKRPSAAKADVDSVGFMRGLKPPPPSGSSFSAACKAQQPLATVSARLKSCADTPSHPETAIQHTLKPRPEVTNQRSVADAYRPFVIPDRCGSCRRCLDACPTGALTEPYKMDARRCISYLTIEHRGPIDEALMEGMGRQVFGCDICQDVCPWNRKSPIGFDPDLEARADLVNPALEWLAAMDESEFELRFNGSPVRRAGFAGLRRNAAIAMGNSGLLRFAPHLEEWSEAADEGIRTAARWALGKLRGN